MKKFVNNEFEHADVLSGIDQDDDNLIKECKRLEKSINGYAK